MADADINKRIAEEQAKINVPSYGDVALDGAWKRRSNMMWGLSALGAAFGVGFGLAAPVFAALGGAQLTTSLVMNSVAIFTATGMSTGLATGAMVGSSVGAAASAAKEMERRVLAREIEQKILDNPDAKVELHTIEAPAPKQPFKIADYVNFKTALLFAAIGTIGGLLAAAALIASGPAGVAAFAMPAMGVLLGSTTPTATAIATYSAGMGAAFGAFFGVNVPKLARLSCNFAGELLSGKAIDAPWPKEANLLSPIGSIANRTSRSWFRSPSKKRKAAAATAGRDF